MGNASDRDTGQDTTGIHAATPDHSDLLSSARRNAIRKSRTGDLRTLVMRLETACEAARLAAIRAIQDAALNDDEEEASVEKFGFARLYSALRRTRAEVGRREIAPRKRKTPGSAQDARMS